MLGRSVTKNAQSSGGTVVTRRAVGMMVAFFVLAALAAVPLGAFAQTDTAVPQAGVDLGLEYATATGLGTTDIRTTIGTVIRIFLGLLGIVAVVIILYAGFLWMTAGGSEERVSAAKKWMVNGVIGLIIILSAYAIVSFIFGAVIGGQGGLVGTGGSGSALTSLYGRGRGTGELGSGIIEYHYPESGQADVARNTKIAITLKKPLVLSTVFRNYVDGFPAPTLTLADDYVCSDGASAETPPDQRPTCIKVDQMTPEQQAELLQLNLLNVKIIPNQSLATPTGGSADEQFDQRYTEQETFLTENPRASVTPVADPLDPEEGQTLVIKPLGTGLGSPTEDTNYRIALRGGETGVYVWSADPGTGEAYADLAFGTLNADGSYFWNFTVGTEIDLTPPRITGIVPGESKYLGYQEGIYRNQLLQIYFDEAIDPTSASGVLGEGGGFTKIEVTATCISTDCDWAGGTVPGEVKLGNRYRTAEFTPSTPCDGVAENSCGEKVYCLPRNTRLTVVVRAASVGSEPPASSLDDGVVDMVGNSFDGNRNGSAEGPEDDARQGAYSINTYRLGPVPADELATMSDDATVGYDVGDQVDLVPPHVTDIVPKSAADSAVCTAPTEQPELCPDASTAFDAGPSQFPVDEPIVVTWSKTISVGSVRTGQYDEGDGTFVPESSTVVLRSYECRKTGTDPCPVGEACPCERLDQMGFTVASDLYPLPGIGDENADQYTRMSIVHRPFFTGNDLGYTLEETQNIPTYEPIIRAQIRDTRQNCFWPSEGFGCSGLESVGTTSCCDRKGQEEFNCWIGGEGS